MANLTELSKGERADGFECLDRYKNGDTVRGRRGKRVRGSLSQPWGHILKLLCIVVLGAHQRNFICRQYWFKERLAHHTQGCLVLKEWVPCHPKKGWPPPLTLLLKTNRGESPHKAPTRVKGPLASRLLFSQLSKHPLSEFLVLSNNNNKKNSVSRIKWIY